MSDASQQGQEAPPARLDIIGEPELPLEPEHPAEGQMRKVRVVALIIVACGITVYAAGWLIPLDSSSFVARFVQVIGVTAAFVAGVFWELLGY